MIHICLGFQDKTGRYAKFTGTTILSIFENTTAPVTVHILHDDTLTPDNRDKFIYVAGHYGQIVKFYNVEKLFPEKIDEMMRLIPEAENSRVSRGAFYRLLIPQIFPPEIEKCIYLDSDIIVNLDIKELWQVELDDKIFAAVPEILSHGTVDVMNIGFELCKDGLVKHEDYFNSGVLVMNLNLLRGEEQTILDGLRFCAQNPRYQDYFDQDVLNYCFSTKTIKLSTKFNRFTSYAREEKESLAKKIYHYAGGSFGFGLGLDMNDPFNSLWMKYFVKTPWFNENTIRNLYEGFKQAQADVKKSVMKISATLNGKARVFIIIEKTLDMLLENFFVREDEDVFVLEDGTPIQKVVDVIYASREEKKFFILIQNFPFNALEEAGLVRGKDFFDGFDFLAKYYNSYPLVKNM